MLVKQKRVKKNINQARIRRENGNASTNKYEKTIKGFLMRKYRNMKSRVSGAQRIKHHLYKGLELLDKEEFYRWSLKSKKFKELFSEWEDSGYVRKLTPSVDRVNSSKGYVISNMEWVTSSENSRRGGISKSINKYEKIIVVGDFHIPYHDEGCLYSFLLFIKWFKPDRIFLNGDIIDFYAISRFVKDPGRALTLQDEIDETISVLRQIRDVSKKAKITYIRGNHSYRLQKYLWSNAKEISGLRLMTVPELLNLKSLNIIYEEKGRLDYKDMIIKHGNVIRKYSAYSAKAEVEKSGKSGISNHTHRQGLYYQNNAGSEILWAETGCMCRKDAEYLEGEIPNWQNGWLVGHFKNNSKRYNLTLVPYVSGKAMYGGMEF